MTKAIQGTEHNFKQGESFQWGAVCGQSFLHDYHTTPNIFKAMEQAGIDPAVCKAKNKETHDIPIMLVLSRHEVMAIMYALKELAGKRYEQAIDRNQEFLKDEASDLRALSDRILQIIREQFVAFENQNPMKKPLRIKSVFTLDEKEQDKRDAVIESMRSKGLPEHIADSFIYRIGLDYAVAGETQNEKK